MKSYQEIYLPLFSNINMYLKTEWFFYDVILTLHLNNYLLEEVFRTFATDLQYGEWKS